MASGETVARSGALRDLDTFSSTIWNRSRRLGIELDEQTGLPRALLAHQPTGRQARFPLRWTVTLVTEGDEVERDPFGLAYANTADLSNFTLTSRTVPHDFEGSDDLFTVSTAVEGWEVDWEYRFRSSAPRLEIQVVLTPGRGRAQGTLRNLLLQIAFAPPDLATWTVEAPGSEMRSGIPADAIAEQTAFSDPCFNGSGIVVLQQPNERSALLIWPFS